MAEKEAGILLDVEVRRSGRRESEVLSLLAAPNDVAAMEKYLAGWLKGRRIHPDRWGAYQLVVRRRNEWKVLHRVGATAEVRDDGQ